MTAEILRRAASLMRERAEASEATGQAWEGAAEELAFVMPRTTAEHIASWHPAVALAVADWLDWVTEPIEALILPHDAPLYVRALAVARAYLGEAADA